MKTIMITAVRQSLVAMLSIIVIGCGDKGLQPDSYPPTVVITFPIEGSVLSAPVKVVCAVNDNSTVAKVEFYVDGTLVSTATKSPFEFVWNVGFWADGGSHALVAKGTDAVGNVGVSQTVTVTISTSALAFPEIVGPTGNIFVDATETYLRWRRVPAAVRYEVQLSTVEDFSSLIVSSTIIDTSLHATNLTFSDYYWRVRAIGPNDNPSGWSSGGTFTTLLPPPNLISPTQGMYIEGAVTSFTWSMVPKATGYELALAADSTFSNLITSVITTDAPALVSGLPTQLRLYWHARTFSPGTVPGHWSSPALFSRFNTFVKEFVDLTISTFQETPDSGFVLCAGQTIVRLNKRGELLWQKTYDVAFASVQSAPDGGFVAAGPSAIPSLRLVKIDANGEVQWNRQYDPPTGYFTSMAVAASGNVVYTGFAPNPGGLFGLVGQAWISAVDPSGNLLWTDSTLYADSFSMIVAAKDGGTALIGTNHQYRYGWGSVVVYKIDALGKVLWSQSLSGGSTSATAIREFENGELAVLYTENGECDVTLLDVSGSIVSTVPVGNPGFSSIAALKSGNWVVLHAGELKKYDASGALQWTHGADAGPMVISTSDDGFLLGGGTSIIKTDPSGDYIRLP